MGWRQVKLGSIFTAISAVLGVAYYASQAKDERLGETQPQQALTAPMVVTYPLDDVVPVQVRLSSAEYLPVVVYLNGQTRGADAYGMMVVTLADWKANPAALIEHELRPEDFPVVAFFNSSMFDVTGAFLVVRRAADGELISEIKDRPSGLVRFVWPNRQGGYNVVMDRGSKVWVQPDRWRACFMGVTEQEAVAAPQAAMPSLEELKQLLFNETKPRHESDD